MLGATSQPFEFKKRKSERIVDRKCMNKDIGQIAINENVLFKIFLFYNSLLVKMNYTIRCRIRLAVGFHSELECISYGLPSAASTLFRSVSQHL